MADIDWGDKASAAIAPPPIDVSPAPAQDSGIDWGDHTSNPAKLAIDSGSKIPPQQAAQVLKLKDQTGLSTDFISRNTEALKTQQSNQAITPAFVEDHPIVMAHMAEDAHQAALVAPDASVWGSIENQFAYMKNQAERGALDTEGSVRKMMKGFGHIDPDNERRIQQIDKRLEFDYNKPPPGPISNVFGHVVESAPMMAGALAVGAAGTVAHVPAGIGTAAAWGAMEFGNAYHEFSQRKDAQGNPAMDDNTARGFAMLSGIGQGALFAVGGKVLEEIPGMKMVSGPGLRSILESPTAFSALKDIAADIGKTGATIGGYSGLASLIHSASGHLGEMKADGSLKDASPGEIISRIITKEDLKAAGHAGLSGLETGLVLGAGAGVIDVAADYRNYINATQARDLYHVNNYMQALRDVWKNIGTAIAGTKMAEVAPDQVEKLVSRMAPDHAFVPLEQWQTYWQSKKADPRAAFQEVVGNTKSYDEALRTGADLQIPAAKYASTIAPSEHAEFFNQHVRSNPLAMNADEAQKSLGIKADMEKEEQVAREKIGQAIAPAGEEAKPTVSDTAQKVSADVAQQLEKAGYSKEESAAQAKLYEAGFRTMGERAGIDPFELYQKYGLKIRRGDELESSQEAGLQSHPEQLSTVKIRQSQKGTGSESEVLERKIFPGPKDSASNQSLTGKPEYIKMRQMATEIVTRYAKEQGVTPTEDFSHSLHAEMHAQINRPRLAGTPEEKMAAYKDVMAKYPNIEKDFPVLADQIKSDGYEWSDWFEKHVKQNYPVKSNEQITEPLQVVKPSEEALNAKGKPFALFIGNQPGLGAMYNVYGEHPTLSTERYNHSTVSGETLAKEGIPITGREARVPEGVMPDETKLKQMPQEKTQTPEFKSWFGESKVIDESGVPKVVYRGDFRADLIKGRFEKGKASSGRFYFTEDPEIASNYAKGKLYYEDTNYENWFKIGEGKNKDNLISAWYKLSSEQQEKVKDMFLRAYKDDETGDVKFGEPDGGIVGKDHWDWQLREARGNWLKAGMETWLNSGALYNDEEQFGKILDKAGLSHTFDNPHEGHPGVHPVYLAIKNPIDASNIPQEFIDAVKGWAATTRTQAKEHGEDAWDKTLRDPKAYAVELEKNAAEHSNHWTTSIPDPVVKIAQKLGYDGIRDKGGKYGGVANDQWIAFEPEQIKSAIGNRGTFSSESSNILKQGGESPLGQLRFGANRQMNIDLFKKANLSSYLHETGHLFLEILGDLAQDPNAKPDIKADFQAILKSFGVDSREKITAEHHEQWAKQFEVYLREGKAPSAELRAPFIRFREWLMDVYQHVKSLGVELSPEVRQVFDRMLASKQQIEGAENLQGIKPLFDDPKAIGMSDEKAARYRDAVDRAHGDAQTDIVRKIVDRQLREKSASWQAERGDIQRTVEQEALQRPEYRARALLGGDQPVNGIEPMKLSKQALETDFPHVPFNSVRGMTTDRGGVHPDIAAEILGFKSGNEMINKIRMTPKIEDFVKQETDARMVERHPDTTSGPNIMDRAMDAVHNSERSKVLRMELEHLASDEFATFKGLVRALGRRIPTIQEVRDDAEKTIGAKTTAETLPSLWQRAEAVSSREAQEHFLRGDFDKAFEAKQAELRNHELYRAAQNAKEQSGKDVAYASKFDRDTIRARIGKAGANYLEQIDSLRDRFDFGRVTLSALGDRQSLREFVESQQKAGYSPDIPPEILNEANKKSWREMTNDELHTVVDTMRNIDHLSGLKTKLLAIAEGREYDDVKADVVNAIQKNFDLKPEDLAQTIDLHPDFKERIQGNIATFAAWRTKMEFLFRFMDKGDYHGPVWETFFKPMNDAEDFKTGRMREAVGQMDEIFKDYSKSDRAKFYSRLTDIPEIGMSMNKMDMMMTALHWGNEGNRTELMRGYKWNEGQVQAIWKNLEPRDLETVNKIWKFVDSFWPEIAKQERELNGLVPEKIQASPFDVTLKDGSKVHMDGGYFPLVYDKNMSYRTAAFGEDAMVKDLFAGGSARAATKHGWSNERVGGGGQAPSLNMSTFVNHVADVIHDLAYRKPVIDLYKLINDEDIRGSIQASAGKELYKQLNPWLKRTAGDRAWNPLGPLEALSSLRSNMTSAELGLKFTSAFIHASSYLTAARELGLKYAVSGLKDSADIRGAWDFVQSKSEFMRSRPDNFDRDIRSAGRDLNIAGVDQGWLGELKAYSPIKRSAFWAVMRGVDLGIAIPTWQGAYRKAMEGGVRNIEEGNEPEAVEYADQLVRDTKGSGAAKDLAPIQSAGGELGKLFTMFYTQLNVIDNQFMEAYREQKQERNIPKLLTTAAMVWFLPAVTTELLRGKTPAQDESWGKYAAKAVALYPMNMIPGLREATSFWQRGDLQASPVFEAIKTMLKTAKSAAQVTPGLKDLVGEKEEWTDKDYSDALMSAGYSTGLPTRQAIKTTQYLHDWMTGAEQPDNPMEGIWRSLVGKKTN